MTKSQTACAMDASAYSYSMAGYGQFSSATTTSSATYTIPQFSIPSGNSSQYLFIWASGGRPTSDADVLFISKITITATPIVSFNLSSSAPSITCGSTTPVTFTVNNGGGTTGVTGYTWNLGSASNGWLYNGGAAPATIPTGATVNSITLTPVCGSALSNISATVATNGINYNTNTSTVTITQPTLTINGGSSFCSGSPSYSINNLPCNSTVSWQANPLGIVSISCPTCPQTNLSRNTDGQVTLTATVTTGCGQPSVTPKAITVGAVPLSSYSIIGAATVYADAGYYYTLKFPNGVLTPNNIFWRVPSGWSITYGQGTANITVLTGNTSGPVQVNFDNVCGESTGIFKMVLIGEGGPAPLRMSMVNAFDISPNPSKGRFTVTLTSIHNNASIKEIIVVNKMGAPVYQQKFTNNQKTQTIQLANLPTDIYTVKIFDGTAWSTQKLSLQK